MKDESKLCFRCKHFYRYYTLGVKRFEKTDCGRCGVKRDVVQNKDVCEKFTARPYYKRNIELIRITLNQLLTELKAVRENLEEETENEEK